MPDGGWNCQRPRGATHSSVHTTISALEGLRLYELHRGRRKRAVRAAQRRGREFLLVHRLFRSHRTGKVIKSDFTRFWFPSRWHYDILRALDYFQAMDAPRDERLADALQIVQERRRKDGRWTLEKRYRGKSYFTLERIGAASRWNTLRCLRVLRWWDGNSRCVYASLGEAKGRFRLTEGPDTYIVWLLDAYAVWIQRAGIDHRV